MDQELQQLLQYIDYCMRESQDPNFDRYLMQMKEILLAEPQRVWEIREVVERNMGRYRENVRARQRSSMEFKIGAGILSGIGILFVLVAAGILIRNFLPRAVQGMMMLAFFTLVWVVSQIGIVRLSRKLALGLSAGSILGVYWAVLWNCHVFETLPLFWTLGIVILVAVLSWLNGYFTRSSVLQCMSLAGFFTTSLFLPWNQGIPEFILLLIALVGLNLMWYLGAVGEQRDVVRLIHMIFYTFCSFVYGIVLLFDIPGEGLTMALVYAIVTAGILNFMYAASRGKGSGAFIGWTVCNLAQISYLVGLIIALQYRKDYVLPQLALILVGLNLLLLLLRKFRWYDMGLYFQSFVLLLFVVEGDLAWPGIVAAVLLMGAGLLLVKEHRLAHQLTMSVYFFFFLVIVTPSSWLVTVELAFLLAFTVLCLYVPGLRDKREGALVYTNLSLMGLMLLNMWPRRLWWEPDYLQDTLVLVLAVLAVLILWRNRCHLPQRVQGLVLGLVLTYMIFVYRIHLPVIMSIALMVIAIGAIIAGFIRNEMALRIYGLVLALFVCAKVVVYDYWDLELLPKSILLLSVGIIAIGISVIYAVLEYRQRKQRGKQTGSKPEA